MDIARQGQQLLLGQHDDGLLPHRPGRLLQVEVFRHRDIEHIVCPAGALRHQRFEYRRRVLSQRGRHRHAVKGAVGVVGKGGIGDLLLLQRPHDVGLFFLVLGHRDSLLCVMFT